MAEKIFSGKIIFLLVVLVGIISSFIISNLIIPRMRKFEGMISVGDMMEGSYGKPGRIITGIAATLLMVGTLGSQVSALGYFISFFLDISFLNSVLLSSGIVVLYSVFGGIRAVTMTDVIQFAVLLVAIPMICNVSLNNFGGYIDLFSALPKSHFQIIPEGESLWKYVGFVFVFMIPFMQPAIAQRFLMAKDTKQMQNVVNITLAIEIPFFWMITVIGLVAFVSFPDISGSHAIPTLITEVLPIGLKGLTIAGIMAVIMSTADSALNTASVTFVHDVLKPSLKKEITQKSELRIAKIVSAVLGIASIIMAVSFKSILDIVFYSFQFWGPVVVVPLYAVIFNIKADTRTFIKSVIAGISCLFAWKIFGLENLLGFDALVPSMLANGFVFFSCVGWNNKKQGRKFFSRDPNTLTDEEKNLQKGSLCQRLKNSFTQKIKTFSRPHLGQALLHAIEKRVEDIQPPYIAFGMFALINYVVPHFMWDMSKPDDFILYFRSFSGLLAVSMILKNYWPLHVEKYRPLVWQITLLFCLPFLATYALFVNQGEVWWIVNLCLSIFILGTLVDWESFLWTLCLGIGAGYLFASTQFPIVLILPTESLYPSIYILVISVAAGLLFSRRRERLQKERLKAVEVAGGAIAHEMRTPLSSVLMNGNLVQMSVTQLKKIATSLSPDHKKELDLEIEDLEDTAQTLVKVSKESQSVINLLLMNMKQDLTDLPKKRLSMKTVIESTLESFVFKGDDAAKVHVNLENDFDVIGHQDLLKHVLFNLLKNSLYFIRASQKGEIFITLEKGPLFHHLIFKDTGPGIEKDQLPKVFTPFYSKNPNGTGIGLSFCQKVLENMKGSIHATSEFGTHTTFELTFPKTVPR